MQAIFEIFTFLELVIIFLLIDGIILVALIKLGMLFAHKMQWMSKKKGDKATSEQQKPRHFNYKPAMYLFLVFLIPFLLGITVQYRDNSEITVWISSPENDQAKELLTDVSKYVLENDIPQLCIGVIIKHQEYSTCTSQVVGNETLSITDNTIFEIGSISKTFTVDAMLSVLNRHSIDLNSTIAPYLPEEVVKANPEVGAITWSQLATHSSGLKKMPMAFNLETLQSVFAAITMGNNAAPFDEKYTWAYLGNPNMTNSTIKTPTYSNLAFGLLGYLVSEVDNQSYSVMLMNEVIDPLSMSQTSLNNSSIDNRAQGYGQFRSVGPFQIIGHSEYMTFSDTLAGAGAINSSVKDMLVYLRHSMSLLKTDVFKQKNHVKKFTERTDINLGWFISQFDHESHEKIIWHDGGTAGFRSYIGFSESNDFGVVVLSSGTKRVDPLGRNILQGLIKNSLRAN